VKVLISAYACEPGKGSEPGAGWIWTLAAAVDHDVWVITRENNRQAIEAALRIEPSARLIPVYVELPRWARWWKQGVRGVRLYYLLWQRAARRTARQLHAEIRFDVAHHITFATDWLPAAIDGLDGLPTIWGPVGGQAPFPWHLRKWLGWKGLAQESVRWLTGGLGRKAFGDRIARTSVVIAQNDEVASRFSHASIVRVEPNVALTSSTTDESNWPPRAPSGPRAVFVGRLVLWKGPLLAISAIAHPAAEAWTLDIYGDGPARRACERLVARLGLDDRVMLHGSRPRPEVLQQVHSADAMLFPSMHDSAPWAVGEALLLGTPVVALDICGPRTLLDRTKGGVAVDPHGDVVTSLAAALNSTLGPERFAPDIAPISAERLPRVLSDWYSVATS